MLALLVGCGSPTIQGDGGCTSRVFDRTCVVDADCALLPHQVDCCGSQVVLGIAASGLSTLQEAERLCVASGPRCRCAAKESVADDGKVFPDAASLKLRCAANRCASYVN